MSSSESEFILENYAGGRISLTTPVVVRELLLTLTDSDISKVSVNIECDRSSGWMWLVYARSVYVWNFKDQVVNFYELPLPSSGLIHSARLCYVFPRPDEDLSKPPACLCASPEGCVRYWSKISQPSSYVEVNVELSGQVGHSLSPLKGKQANVAVILSTTTCGLFLLFASDSRQTRNQTINCVTLKVPQNLISGIGRRVSSLIFATGFSSSQDALVNVSVTTKRGSPNTSLLYLLNTKCQLQCWQLEPEGENKLVSDTDLRQTTTEKVAYETWRLKPAEVQLRQNLRTWPLDFVVTARRRFAILVAIFDPSLSSSTVHYAVVFYNEREGSSAEFIGCFRLPFSRSYEPRLEEIGCNCLRLFCPFSYDGFFVHDASILATCHEDQRRIYSLSLTGGDQIFGAGVHGDQRLVFTLEGGLQIGKIAVKGLGLPYVTDLGNERFQLHQLSKSEVELEEMADDSDRKMRLNAAFVYFLKHQVAECENILEGLFSGGWDDLDELVVQIGTDIVDDYPASDPRWMQAFDRHVADRGGMTTRQKSKARRTEGGSLLLVYQLDDKRKSIELLLSFLKSTNLKERLRKCQLNDGRSAPTLAVLCGLGERLDACASFAQKAESQLKKESQRAMEQILKQRGESTGGTLVARDVFYRKVSAFHDFVPVFIKEGLAAVEKRQEHADSRNTVELITRLAEALLIILNASSNYRRLFEQSLHWRIPNDLQTWLNVEAVRNSLEKCYQRMTDCLSEVVDAPVADVLTKQCRELADFILSESSIAPDRRLFVAQLKRRLINSLVANECFDQALSLAEKYRDFGLIIEICEKLRDESLLDSYKIKFRDDRFLEYLYDYFIEKGKPGQIFHDEKLIPNSEVAIETARYVESRRRPDLKWIFNAKMNEFEKASVELLSLAHTEDDSLEKKKTYLSLAKLAALASDRPDESSCLKSSDEGLSLIEHQKRLSSVSDAAPLSAKELIEAYISDPAADEWYFCRAIDILTSVYALNVPKEEYNSMRTHLWASAILMDDWNAILNTNDDLLIAAANTVFCRTLKLLTTVYKDDRRRLAEYISSADELLQSELEELADDPKFQYVMRAGEEEMRAWMMENA